MANNDNQHNNDSEKVDLSADDQEFLRSVDQGVMDDELNYKRLYFWTGFIIVMVAVFLVALIEMYDYTSYVLNEKAQQQANFNQIEELKEEGNKKLNSFGVNNAEQGVYHIPIDSAIQNMAQDSAR